MIQVASFQEIWTLSGGKFFSWLIFPCIHIKDIFPTKRDLF